MNFTLDTNVLIRMATQYPREIFPSVWDKLEDLITSAQACICQEVHEETSRGSDGLYAWASNQADFVCEVEDAEVDMAQVISEAYPEWVRESFNAADPFLIAHAKVDNLTIVSDERKAGPGVIAKNQKVPNVAEAYNVPCMNFFGMASHLKWRF